MTPAEVPIYTPNPATRWNGAELILVEKGDDFDPAQGWVYTAEYAGTSAKVAEFLLLVNPYRVRVTKRIVDDRTHVRLVSPDPTFGISGIPGATPELPVDTFEFSTEYAMLEIWQNPQIISLTFTGHLPVGWNKTYEQTRILTRYKHFVTTRLKSLYKGYVDLDTELAGNIPSQKGEGPTPMDKLGLLNVDGTATTAAKNDFALSTLTGATDNNAEVRVKALSDIYWTHILGGGVDLNYAYRMVVLSRRRSVSAVYSKQIVVGGVETVYSTAALKKKYGIPQDVYDRLPGDPANFPESTKWGWRERRQDSTQVSRSGKVEETIDWQFAAWSILLYSFKEEADVTPDPI